MKCSLLLCLISLLTIGCSTTLDNSESGPHEITTYSYHRNGNIVWVKEENQLLNSELVPYLSYLTQQEYDNNGNLLKEVVYDLTETDTSLSDILIQRFNKDNQLTYSMDSSGSGQDFTEYQYSQGKLQKTDRISIIYKRDLANMRLEILSVDTSRVVLLPQYRDTINHQTISLSWDYSFQRLFKELTPDTTMIAHSYDKQGNQIESLSTKNGKLLWVSDSEFDHKNQLVSDRTFSSESGLSKSTYAYDDQGNEITEVIESSTFKYRTEKKYNKDNQLIETRTYWNN